MGLFCISWFGDGRIIDQGKNVDLVRCGKEYYFAASPFVRAVSLFIT
jgi:hypothetical protein